MNTPRRKIESGSGQSPKPPASSERKSSRHKRASTLQTPQKSDQQSEKVGGNSRIHTEQSQSQSAESVKLQNPFSSPNNLRGNSLKPLRTPLKKLESDVSERFSENNSNLYQTPSATSRQTRKVTTSSSVGKSVQSENSLEEKIRIAQGSFGVVYKAKFQTTKEEVAVKRVLQNSNHKNRELQLMQELSHPNIVELKYSFYSFGEQGEAYLNLIMEYVPSNLIRMIRYYHRKKPKITAASALNISIDLSTRGGSSSPQKNSPAASGPAELFPDILVKLYMYQILSALAYLNERSIAHRDLKPANILINHLTHAMKLCDFGSAKKLNRQESNLSYICSRHYRAPELILGASFYTTSVDMWSLGCTVCEMIIGEPLFKGESSIDQLIEIMKVLGTPTPEQIIAMNPEHKISRYPPINKIPFSRVFEKVTIKRDLLELLEKMLMYEPNRRISPIEAMRSPYFNELRIEQCRINGKKLPPLIKADYSFTKALQPMFPKV